MAILETLKIYLDADSTGAQAAFQKAERSLAAYEKRTDQFARAVKQYTRENERMEKATERAAKAADRAAAATARQAAAAEKAAIKESIAAQKALVASDKRVAAAQKVAQAETRARERASSAAEKQTANFAKEIAIFQRYRAAAFLVAEGLRTIYKTAEDGARAATASEYFRNAGKSLDEYRAATRGLISDAELMKKANLADTMGLSGETFKSLAAIAHASAAKTGQSYEHMLNSIILGTARESRLLLDNLGIIISVTDAKKNYAKSLKEGADGAKYAGMSVDKLADSLTDAAEKEAFFQEVSRKGLKPLQEQADVGQTAADNFDRFAAAVDNLRIALGQLIAEGSTSLIAKIAKEVQAVAKEVDRLNRVGMKAESVPGAIGKNLPSSMSPGNLLFGLPVLDLVRGTAKDASLEAEQDIQAEYDVFVEKLAGAGLALEELDRLAELVRDYPDEALNQFGNEVLNAADQVKELAKKLGIALPKFQPPKASPVDPDKLLPKGKGGARVTITNFQEEDYDPIEIMRAYGNALWEAIALKADSTFQKVAEAARKAFVKTPTNMQSGAAGALGTATPGDIDRQIRAEARRQMAADREQKAAEAVGGARSIISAAMSGSASALGAGIGGFFGPLGTAVGSLIGELLDPLQPVIDLLAHLASGIKGLLELGLNPFLETLRPLGPVLETFLRAVGVLANATLQPLIPLMNLLVTVLVVVINAISWVVVVLSPFAEMILALIQVFPILAEVIWSIVDLFFNLAGGDLLSFGQAMEVAVRNVETWTETMMKGAVTFHNGIIDIVRSIGRFLEDTTGGVDFGLSDFGDRLTLEDLIPPTEPINDNTEATDANTRAVEQLSRDLRNLPSGYKVNYALYQATAPASRQLPALPGQIAGREGARRFPDNFRWRT